MKSAGLVTWGTDLDNPDFAGIARTNLRELEAE